MIDIKNIFDKHNFSTHLTDTNPFSNIDRVNSQTVAYNRFLDLTHSIPEDMKRHNSIEIVDKRLKAIMPIGDNYFHYFSDFVGPIILFIEECINNRVKDVHLLLTSDHEPKVVKNFDGFLSYCLEKFKDKINITYQYVYFSEHKYIRTNNSIIIFQRDIGESINQIYENITNFAQCKLDKPTRNVFLSRRQDKISDHSYNRIANEQECEAYFASLGFEIAYADNFKSLEEEVRYFNETKILVGLSGAGLTNAMFMQEGQILVELVTPMKLGSSGEKRYELHNFYKTISALKDHKLISISNINRSSDDIISDLKLFKDILQ